MVQTARRKASLAAYAKTPGRKASLAAYAKTPKRRATALAYASTPERKALRSAYEKTPRSKAIKAAYQKTPKRKAAMSAYFRTPRSKAARAARARTPEGKRAAAAYAHAHPAMVCVIAARHRALKRQASGRHTAAERLALLAANDGFCTYCPSPATTLDHIIALSRGGSNGIKNMTPACQPCNSSKGNRPVFEWLQP